MSDPTAAPQLPLDTPTADRRTAPRVRVTYRVTLRCGSRELVGHTADVSLRGAFVETLEDLAPGTSVHVALSVGRGTAEEAVQVDGRVARRVAPADAAARGGIPGLGIEFTRFLWGQDALRHALAQLLSDQRAGGAAGRRLGARVAVGLPIYWGHAGKPNQAGFLTNLSSSGAFFIESRATVPEGARLHLWFELPVRGEVHVVRAVAIVARVAEREGDDDEQVGGMGIHFEQSTVDSAVLQDFLDERLTDGLEPPGPRALPSPPAAYQPLRAAASPHPSTARPAPDRRAPAPLRPRTAPVRPAPPSPPLERPPIPPSTRRAAAVATTHLRHEDVFPTALDQLFAEALAEWEEAERRKLPPLGPPVHEGLRQGDVASLDATQMLLLAQLTTPAVDWLRLVRLALKASGVMIALLLAIFITLLLHLV